MSDKPTYHCGTPERGVVYAWEGEVAALQARLDQIAIVCRDNSASTCNHAMALNFVWQIAERKS